MKQKTNITTLPKKDVAHPLEHINIFNRSSMIHLIEQYDLNLINFKILEKYIKIVGLKELINIFPDILQGKIAGRILVDLKR